MPTAIDSIGLRPEHRARLAAVAAKAQARVMLIRRVGRQPRGPARSWCVLDDPATAAGPVTTWGTWIVGEDLLRPADLLSRQAASERRDLGPRPPQPPQLRDAEPELLLVCTHGRHDVCCAVRGRPVAAALAGEWPEATWECSHTGGDRFAANVIALPDGACYGGLDPDTAVTVLRRHVTGAPDTAYLRGRTGCAPAAQAALLAVHRVLPEAAWGEISVAGMTSQGSTHTVRLRADTSEFDVPVTEHVREPHQLTCAATSPNRATVPVAGEVRRLS